MIARGLWTGALAGFAVGAGDALVSWGRLGQFMPGAFGRLGCALYAGALAAFALGLLAAGVAAVAALLVRHTALGGILARRGEPSLARTALAIAAVPCVAAALAIAMRVGLITLKTRHHQGLIIAVTVAATAGLLLAAVVATLLLGRLVELALRPLGLRALAARWAPAVAAGALVVGGLVVLAVVNRKLVAQLPLRPYVVLAVWALACIPFAALARRLLERVPARRRALVHPVIVVGPLLCALMVGASDAARKGAAAHTGLTEPVTALVHRLFDLDRDGYSSVLGGGDCDDLDRAVHPGAMDTPGDGIDQNCLGGDVGAGAGEPRDPKFAAVPATVPADANVLIITIDTLRADHVGAYGYGRPTTPAIDAIGKKGFVFENGWAHAPSTRYSMPAILTGRHPSEIAWDYRARTAESWWPGLDPSNDTIGKVLRSRDMFGGAFLNYHYFDRVRRFDQGFAVYDNSNARLHSGSDPASTRGTSSREQADAALRFLDANGGKRFFLWVHFYDPHYEYEKHPGSPSFGDDKLALYDGEIRFTDDQVARLFARLTELGVTDKTIVVITGDHGEGFGEHGVNFHGYHLYAPQTKVPFIMYVPGLAPRRVQTAVGHVDILPTLANLVGAPPSAQTSGRSLLPFILGAEEPERGVYQDLSWENNHEKRGLVTSRWHLVYNLSPEGTFELYDVTADPGETRDLWGVAPEGQALAERLAGMIDAAQAAARGAGGGGVVLASPPKPRVAVRAELGDGIRLLGADFPAEAKAGSEIDVTWYWESRGKVAGRWRPFVHFEGSTGRFLGDHEPALALAQWKAGQIIADRHKVQVGREAGEYTVYVGWWQGNERLPVSGAGAADGGENRVKVGTLRVVP